MDVLVGNEEDLQKSLGIPGPEVAAKSKLDPSAFSGDIAMASLDEVRAFAQGEFKPASALPSEVELCVRFEVSRNVMREVIKGLSTKKTD